MWSPLTYPCQKGQEGENCDKYCLYNIIDDPTEHKDLSKTQTDILENLLKRYNEYAKEPREMQDQGYHSHSELPVAKEACEYMRQHGEYWQPWK